MKRILNILLLSFFLLLSFIAGTGFNVHAQDDEEGMQEQPSETEAPGQQEENSEEEVSEENDPEEDPSEQNTEASSEPEEDTPKPGYVPADEIVSGSSYVLAYEENGSFSILFAENGELKTENHLSVLNEDTVSGRDWTADGEYGVYAIHATAEDGNERWLYLDADGWHLSAEAKAGWEIAGDCLQYTDEEDNIYGLFDHESAFIFYEPEQVRPFLFSGLSFRGTARDSAEPGMHYIAFGSDRHGSKEAIGQAMGRMPESVEYVSLVGDLVGDGGGSHPSYKYSDIYNEVKSVFQNLQQKKVSILWASHDESAVDDSDEGVTGVYCREEGSSKLIYTSTNESGNPLFYLYGIAFYDMKNGSDEPARKFREWVDTLPEAVPIIVICHMPIHANRADNRSAYYWHDALNYAATEGGKEIVRNVIFIHGHNHTTEQNQEYYWEPGSTIQVPSPGKRDRTGIASEIQYTYITGGYLNANQTATLIGVSDTTITLKKYYDQTPGDNVTRFDVTLLRVEQNKPHLSISNTSLVLEEEGQSSVLTAAAKNISESTDITWSSDHPEIALVNNGTVTPVSEGTAIITASLTAGGTVYSASCTVIVNKKKYVPSGNAFVLTDHLEAGQEYLIVNVKEAGSGKVLKNNSGTVTCSDVTIQNDSENGIYIWKKDTDDTLVWTAEESDGDEFFLKNGTYLTVGNNGLSMQDTAPRNGFSYENLLLSHSGGFRPRENASTQQGSLQAPPTPPSPTRNYIFYDSKTGQFISSKTASKVYLYGRKTASEKKEESGKDNSSSSSSASIGTVVTCQMAGYPEGYAWDEATKTCRMGYLDENGVFHSTSAIKRKSTPNTSDKGLTGFLFSFLISVSISGICLIILEKYR